MNALGRFAKFPAVNAEKYAMTRVVLGVAWNMAGIGWPRHVVASHGKDRNWVWFGTASQGGARRGEAWLGTRRGSGPARQFMARQVSARQGVARNVAGRGKARTGAAWPGVAGRGKARNRDWPGWAGPGTARHGGARQGKATWVRR